MGFSGEDSFGVRGLLHDVANLLSVAGGNLSFLREKQELGKEALLALSAAEAALQRASAMAGSAICEEEGDKNSCGELDLVRLFRSIVTMLERAVAADIEFDISAENSECRWPCDSLSDELSLTQVFFNILFNACEAIEKRGKISIEIQRNGEHFLVCSIRDDGRGMSQQELAEILSRQPGGKRRGRGFGLLIARSIIDKLGGKLSIRSERGLGSDFELSLPISRPCLRITECSYGDAQILVVDDEEAIRDVLRASLEHLGYCACVASGGKEALEILAKMRNCRLVIIDMLMPGMSGEQLFFELRRSNPDLAVIVSSGCVEGGCRSRIEREGDAYFLDKPFAIGDLRRVLERSLGGLVSSKS